MYWSWQNNLWEELRETKNWWLWQHHDWYGTQAKCSVLVSKLQPPAIIDSHIPNHESMKCMKDLSVVKIDDTTYGGHTTKSVFLISLTIQTRALLLQDIIQGLWRRVRKFLFWKENNRAIKSWRWRRKTTEIVSVVFVLETRIRTSSWSKIKTSLLMMTVNQLMRIFLKKKLVFLFYLTVQVGVILGLIKGECLFLPINTQVSKAGGRQQKSLLEAFQKMVL